MFEVALFLEAAVRDNGQAGRLAEGASILGIGCRAVAPAHAEKGLRQRPWQRVEEDGSEHRLAAQMPRGIGVEAELVHRPAACGVARMNEAEPAGYVQIVDAEL